MWTRHFVNFEFFAIFFGILFFYLSNYISSFRLMELESSATITQQLAQGVLIVSITLSLMSIWSNRSVFLRHGNGYKLAILFGITGLLLLATKNMGVLLSLPVGLSLINTSDRSTFQYIFYSSILFYSVTLTLYASGFLWGGDKIDTPLFDSKDNIQHLYSLGFDNPNVAFKFFIPILLSTLYLFGNRKRVIVSLAVVSTTLGILTGSTTGFIVALTACLGFSVIHKKSVKKIVRTLAPHMFIALTVVSLFIALSFGPAGSLPNPVDDALTGRPALWNLRIENGSYLNIIGSNDEYISKKFDKNGAEQSYFQLDNAFLYIMVYYGLSIYLLYYLVYRKSTKIINDERLLLVYLSILLLSIVERSDFITNIYLLFAIKHLAKYYFDKEKDQ